MMRGQFLFTTDYIVGAYSSQADYSLYGQQLQQLMADYVKQFQCNGQSQPTVTPAALNGTPQSIRVCHASPPPHLVIGGKGQVTPGLPDRLRDKPSLSGNILALLPAGATFTVLDGPKCEPATGLTWWQVQYNSPSSPPLSGWLVEGVGDSYYAAPLKGN